MSICSLSRIDKETWVDVRCMKRHGWCVLETTNVNSVACDLGGMSYSLPRSSDFLDEQKMDVVTDTGN